MTVDEALEHLHAPTEQGGVLIQPAPDRAASLAQANAVELQTCDGDCLGRPLADLVQEARRELLTAAFAYTQQYCDVAAPTLDDALSRPVFIAGHQAELFHPGVWAKNFVLARLARESGATPVNLIVDGDLVKKSAVRVPERVGDTYRFKLVEFDRQAGELPAEERTILDHDLWRSFGRRASEAIRPFASHPLIDDYWPKVLARTDAGVRPAVAVAQARRQVEGEWGAGTWELPLSVTCGFKSFAWFLGEVLSKLPCFWACYNGALAEYREKYGVRSKHHPVPELIEQDNWIEAPFWVWSHDRPQRKRLFAKRKGDTLTLTDRADWAVDIPLVADGDPEPGVAALQELFAQGVKFRTRALTTTMWSRLVLGDLFIHGLGGAKYDRLTDVVLERFWGVTPPAFYAVTATWRLPSSPPKPALHASAIASSLRELEYNPQRYINEILNGDAQAAAEIRRLASDKQRWVETPKTDANAHERHLAINRLNAALQPWMTPVRERLLRQRIDLQHDQQAASVLGWREYAFALHDTAALRQFLTGLAK